MDRLQLPFAAAKPTQLNLYQPHGVFLLVVPAQFKVNRDWVRHTQIKGRYCPTGSYEMVRFQQRFTSSCVTKSPQRTEIFKKMTFLLPCCDIYGVTTPILHNSRSRIQHVSVVSKKLFSGAVSTKLTAVGPCTISVFRPCHPGERWPNGPHGTVRPGHRKSRHD